MRKVNAISYLEVVCSCPYCNAFEDVFEDVREEMDECLRANNCNIQVTCSECNRDFIVENVMH